MLPTFLLAMITGLAGAPTFDVKVADAGPYTESPGVVVQVKPTAGGAVADRAAVAVDSRTFVLAPDVDGVSFSGFIPMKPGVHELRVVVAAGAQASELDVDAEVGPR